LSHNQNEDHNPKLRVAIQPNIGLDSDVRLSIVELLNIILADEAVLTIKTRSAHWNVRGTDFSELHTLYSTQYHLLNSISDKIAERARMMGGFAVSTLAEFLKCTRLEEQPGVVPDALHLLADHEASIRFLREDARKCSEEFEDEGSSELLVNVMYLHERMAWMLRSFIENEPVYGENNNGL
jgi:starvation-inducible DNA-binding protein